jgi:hypothetical protein
MKTEKERIEIYKKALKEAYSIEELVKKFRKKLFNQHRIKYLKMLK